MSRFGSSQCATWFEAPLLILALRHASPLSVSDWVNDIETTKKGRKVFVGSAKLDQHLRKSATTSSSTLRPLAPSDTRTAFRPLSGFIQIFNALMARVFTDPRELSMSSRVHCSAS